MLIVFLVADLIFFCYVRDFVLSLSEDGVIETFDSTARYLDDLLNIDNHLIENFEQMVIQIYPTALKLSKANSFDTITPFMDLDLSINDSIFTSEMYDKRVTTIQHWLKNSSATRHIRTYILW